MWHYIVLYNVWQFLYSDIVFTRFGSIIEIFPSYKVMHNASIWHHFMISGSPTLGPPSILRIERSQCWFRPRSPLYGERHWRGCSTAPSFSESLYIYSALQYYCYNLWHIIWSVYSIVHINITLHYDISVQVHFLYFVTIFAWCIAIHGSI